MLLDLTPVAFAFPACNAIEEAVRGSNKSFTVLAFLRFAKEMATVFLQDAAAMWVCFPERKTHPIFSLNVFASGEWEVSRNSLYLREFFIVFLSNLNFLSMYLNT